MKKILIALDYNPTAQKVAETGYEFAKEMHAEITLLHVISDPVYYSSSVYSPIMGFGGYVGIDFLQKDITDELIKSSYSFLSKTIIHLGDKTIHTRVTVGNVADSILALSKEIHTDIIIMGSHSRKWLEAIVIGSAAEKVLRQTTIPLLIIPTKKRD